MSIKGILDNKLFFEVGKDTFEFPCRLRQRTVYERKFGDPRGAKATHSIYTVCGLLTCKGFREGIMLTVNGKHFVTLSSYFIPLGSDYICLYVKEIKE